MAKRERAPRGTGSITPYGNGRFKGIITTGYKIDPVTKKKKRITKTFTGSTRKEVQQKITEYQYSINVGKINPTAAPITYEQYKERWLAIKHTELKPQSWAEYQYVLNALSFGDTPLKDITVADINSLFIEQLKTKSPVTVRRYKTELHAFFDSARKEKLIIENPVADTIKIKSESKSGLEAEMHVLTKEEAIHLLTVAKDSQFPSWFYPIVRTALETGMRKSELRALQYKSLGEDIIHVYHSVSDAKGQTNTIVSPKTKSSIRKIHVDKALITYLKSLPHQSEDDFIFHSNKEGSNAILNASTVSFQFKKLVAASGIDKPLHFHDLRHTHATLLIMAGVNIKTVSSRLGHANINITLNLYTHALPQQDQEASELIATMLQPATTNDAKQV